ncbi:hypothetical protein B2G63_04675 [Pseudomonas aeruginosa]|nr:hypothetical protein B2G63_04675 [Pseudomonas aeruginosa]
MGDHLLNLPWQHARQALSSQLGQCVMDGGTLAIRRRKARHVVGLTSETTPHRFLQPVDPSDERICGHSVGARPTLGFQPEGDVTCDFLGVVTFGELSLGRSPGFAANSRLLGESAGERASRTSAERADRVGQEVQQSIDVERLPAHLHGKG